jgi:coenzyme F420-reducing hydrogenase beta subunit
METVLEDMETCVGCSACELCSPMQCISMKPDDEGFLYPEIDEPACIDCELCQKVCPVFEDPGPRSEESEVYACWVHRDELRLASSSGGIFSVLAEQCLAAGGRVFGAAFDERFGVHHTECSDERELAALRGSKYVESHIDGTYRKTEQLLKSGHPVLFSGVPCQIAGLRGFLRKDYEALLTVEVVCSGVPSPEVWTMYLAYMAKRYGGELTKVAFRDKQKGWTKGRVTMEFANGKRYSIETYRDSYLIGYGKGLFNRKCCYDCQFTHSRTEADITLGDFWGIAGDLANAESARKGVTLLLVHTPKGKAALDGVRDGLRIETRSLEQATRHNQRVLSSLPLPDARTAFFRDLASGASFEQLRNRYMASSYLAHRVKAPLKALLGTNRWRQLKTLVRRLRR